MSNTRIIEMQIQQIIRLWESGYSIRRISKELSLHRKTVSNYLELFKTSGATIAELTDSERSIQQYFSKLAAEKGENVQRYIDLLIDQKPYPEQAYRQALGILALCRQYEVIRVETACELAMKYSKCSYNTIKQIIENGKDKNHQTMDNEILIGIPSHENIRGSEYYM